MKRLRHPWNTIGLALLLWIATVALVRLAVGDRVSNTGFWVGVGCMSLGLAIGAYRGVRWPPPAGPFAGNG